MNKEILNEFYFGRSLITQYLEDALDCFSSLIKNNFNDKIKEKLNKINKYIKPIIEKNNEEKTNFINGRSKYYVRGLSDNRHNLYSCMDKLKNYAISVVQDSLKENSEENVDLTDFNNYNLIKDSAIIIKELLRIVFGYNCVFIVITKPKHKTKNDHIHMLKISVNPLIRRLENDKIMDDFFRELDKDEIINSINIMNNGIFIDYRKYALSIILYINIEFLQSNIFTSSEFLSVIFHEIGHTFSKLLTPHVNLDISSRQDEKFADKFVSLYGYSNELITFFDKATYIWHKSQFQKLKSTNFNEKIKDKKEIANHIYTKIYEKRKTGLTEKEAKHKITVIDNNLYDLYDKLNNTNLTPSEKKYY